MAAEKQATNHRYPTGKIIAMDFNDTPEEAKFRAEARAFLDANAKRRSKDSSAVRQRYDESADAIAKAKTDDEAVAIAFTFQHQLALFSGPSLSRKICRALSCRNNS